MEQHIKVLRQQIEKLNDPKFDLEAWKLATSVLLRRIFGPHDAKIKWVEEIRFDYGSWSLRDADGSDHAALGKKRATEILEAGILELETLGAPQASEGPLPQETANQTLPLSQVLEVIENELSVSQFKKLAAELKNVAPEEQAEALKNQLQIFGSPIAFQIVAQLLLLPELKAQLLAGHP
ncbi:MAG: hypothetical protein ACFB10_14480 [Salibacteraceae bacterium]